MKELSLPLSKYWLSKLTTKRQTITATEYTPEEAAWDKLLMESTATPHYMQSSAWGVSKSHSQWPISRYVAYTSDGVVPIQVFSRTVPGLGRLHYAPEVSGITTHNVGAITEQLKNQYGRGLVFKLELYQPYSDQLVDAMQQVGWLKAHSVQHRNTVIVDLSGDADALLSRMKKRARYEVRLAERLGVRVEKHPVSKEKLDLLATLMNITAKRSGAFFRKNDYTSRYWNAFAQADQGMLYFAWHDADLLAGAFVVKLGTSAWYKDGGSVRQKSNLMGPRLLQWEIMRDMQSQGVKQYDLSGIPPEAERETSSMKGLYTFKTGFAKDTAPLMPAMELPFGKRYSVWPKTEHQFLRFYSGFRKDFWY